MALRKSGPRSCPQKEVKLPVSYGQSRSETRIVWGDYTARNVSF